MISYTCAGHHGLGTFRVTVSASPKNPDAGLYVTEHDLPAATIQHHTRTARCRTHLVCGGDSSLQSCVQLSSTLVEVSTRLDLFPRHIDSFDLRSRATLRLHSFVYSIRLKTHDKVRKSIKYARGAFTCAGFCVLALGRRLSFVRHAMVFRESDPWDC